MISVHSAARRECSIFPPTITTYDRRFGPCETVQLRSEADDQQIQISSARGGHAYLITTYTYNDANELTSETDNGVTQSYSYDAAGELLGDALVTYAYDPNGNRAELVRMSSSSGSGSGNNEVVNDGTWTYTYDIRGDLIGKNDGAGDIWTYTYDVGNRLVGRKSRSPTAARRKSVIRTMCSTT